MVERNELDRSLLALLDENIADAHKNDQVRTVGCFIFVPLVQFWLLRLCYVFNLVAIVWFNLQKQAAEFMEKIRAAILKYMTVW